MREWKYWFSFLIGKGERRIAMEVCGFKRNDDHIKLEVKRKGE